MPNIEPTNHIKESTTHYSCERMIKEGKGCCGCLGHRCSSLNIDPTKGYFGDKMPKINLFEGDWEKEFDSKTDALRKTSVGTPESFYDTDGIKSFIRTLLTKQREQIQLEHEQKLKNEEPLEK